MCAVVSPEFCEKWQLKIAGNVELFIWRNRLINILSFPKFTLSVEWTHVVEEDAVLLEFSSRCAFDRMPAGREDGGKPYLHKSPSGSSGTYPSTHEFRWLLSMCKYFCMDCQMWCGQRRWGLQILLPEVRSRDIFPVSVSRNCRMGTYSPHVDRGQHFSKNIQVNRPILELCGRHVINASDGSPSSCALPTTCL